MGYPKPDDVQYDLSLYGCGNITELNDFCVLFAVPSPLMLLSTILPTVAHSIALLAGDTGRSYTIDFLRNGEQSADNPDFTVCIIRCVYRAELILGSSIVYLSYKEPCPTISIHKRYIHVP